jgi:hypothetical protein
LKEDLQAMSKGLAQAEIQLESFKSRLPNRDNFMEQLQSDNRHAIIYYSHVQAFKN